MSYVEPTAAEADAAQIEAERARAIALALSLESLRYNKLPLYDETFWSPKQRDFFNLRRLDRLFMAGNQLGKTLAGGYETALHLTGRYPEWWKGHRFDRAVDWWCGGINGMKIRDNAQRKLLGRVSDIGTGFIPKECLRRPAMNKGTTGLVDFIEIEHVSGGTSVLKFMSYDSDDMTWESDTCHGIWYDEEPPEAKHTAGIARRTTTFGISFMTFTPLYGMSEVVRLYFPTPSTPERGYIRMGINDATHIPPERRTALMRNYKRHERKARGEGFPILGEGNVYDVDEPDIVYDATSMPDHWPQIIGLDIGGGASDTAFMKGHWDRDNDCIYFSHAYALTDPRISTHAAALRAQGTWVPIAWPHDAHQHERSGDGETYASIYKKHGVNMLPAHAQMPDGGYQLEPSVTLVEDRMTSGRLKIARHLDKFWEQYRLYHREKGRIVKAHDHLLDAMRYAVMMHTYARVPPKHRKMQTTVGMDYDPLRG